MSQLLSVPQRHGSSIWSQIKHISVSHRTYSSFSVASIHRWDRSGVLVDLYARPGGLGVHCTTYVQYRLGTSTRRLAKLTMTLSTNCFCINEQSLTVSVGKNFHMNPCFEAKVSWCLGSYNTRYKVISTLGQPTKALESLS